MVSRTQAFTYDPDAALASATHAGAGGPSNTTSYAHNDAGQPISTTDWRSKVSTTAYLPSGAPSTRTLGSGVATAGFEWHADGMPEAMTWRNGANQVVRSHTAIGYDGGGRRESEYVTALQPSGLTTAGTAGYGYDLAERLTSWTSPFADPGAGEALSVSYDLDDGSNIEGATTTGATSGTVVATVAAAYPNGRLESRTTTAGGTSATEAFTYDGLGQEILRQGDDIDTASAYDPRGHTTEVDDRTGEDDDVTSVYDGTDRLISRTEPGAGPDRTETILYFYWGGGASLAEEADGAGNTLVRYACEPGGMALAQQSYRVVDGHADPSDADGTWRWLLPDADANVSTQLNDDGTVAEQSAFDPYGKPQAGGSSVTDPKAKGSTLGFQGAITDKVTGSVVLGPRLYDPSTARFSTADSFVAGGLDLGLALDPLTGNRYLFAGANPVAYFDDGHAPREQLYREGKPYPRKPAPAPAERLHRESNPNSVPDPTPAKKSDCVTGENPNGTCRSIVRGAVRNAKALVRWRTNSAGRYWSFAAERLGGGEGFSCGNRTRCVSDSWLIVPYADAGTMGNTIVCRDECDAETIAHEMVHVDQFQDGGVVYAALYVWESLFGGITCGNKYERPAYDAGLGPC
jgi:RHS repeat-associated protein